MKQILNTQGNVSDEVIVKSDKIYVHTNIEKVSGETNLYNYDEYQFEANEKASELVGGLVDQRDADIVGLLDDIEELCNELIGE